MRLRKRQQTIGGQTNNIKTRLIVLHVPIDEHELLVQKLREKQLQLYNDEQEVKTEESVKRAINGNNYAVHALKPLIHLHFSKYSFGSFLYISISSILLFSVILFCSFTTLSSLLHNLM